MSAESVLLEEGERYTLEIGNYRELGEPSVKWAVEEREVATVRNNKDGTAEITAKAAGEATIVVKAENCEEAQCRVQVKKAPIASIAGTAWQTQDGCYYFLPEGNYYYFISPRTENYIKGGIEIRELEKEELAATEASALVNAVDRAAYFRLDASADLELYFGSRRTGAHYTIYVAANEEEAAIFDSGWSEAMPAQKAELLLAEALDAKFPGGAELPQDAAAGAGTGAEVSYAGSAFTVADADFNGDVAYKESWNILQLGNDIIFKQGDDSGNALYRLSLGDLSAQPELLYQPEAGSVVTVFGTDGTQLILGTGSTSDGSYTTGALYRMDPGGSSPELLVNDKVQDFCIVDGVIYYTDYSRLVRLDMSGNSKVLWEYGVYCYEVTEDGLVFLHDGDAWELLDAETGEDYGYIRDGDNYSYECDLAEFDGDYLYYVAYDYDQEKVSLRALDIWTGTELTIGSAYHGSKNDTYCVAYYDSYVLFTAEDGESVVRIDVATGEEQQIYLEDAGYWYANEIILVDGRPVLSLQDDDENIHFAIMDENMSLQALAL